MKLVAEIIPGSLFYVEIEEDATVGDLKTLIENQQKVPRDRLVLMLDADQCPVLDKDEEHLNDYGVQQSSHIYIFFRALCDVSIAPSLPNISDDEKPPSIEYSSS